MLKSLNKKGFTLIEVLCSLGVFSIIFVCIMSFDITSLNIKKDIKTTNNNVLIMETLKNNIIYTMTYAELEQLIKDNKIYINKESMDFDKIKISVINVFSSQMPSAGQYIKLSFVKDEFMVYRLTLSLFNRLPNDILELQCNFYKGDHK